MLYSYSLSVAVSFRATALSRAMLALLIGAALLRGGTVLVRLAGTLALFMLPGSGVTYLYV